MTLLAYDVEVFSHNSMVVFKDMEGKTVQVFSSSLDGLGEYLDQGLITDAGYGDLEDFIRGKTLVGYNNYGYDDYILYAMSKKLPQSVIKAWNDSIIGKGSLVNMKKIEVCQTLDCFQQINVMKPGLKKVEGNMGVSIVESTIDFTIDRPLTPQENLEVLKYCEYDVLQTVEIYKMRKQYWQTKADVVDMMEEDHLKDRAMKWNTTSIVAQILRPKRRAPARRLVPDDLLEMVPTEVAEMWRELDTTIDFKFKKRKVVVEEFGNIIEFGWGGLHGAPKGIVRRENVRLADVQSMYPNILINFGGLGEKTDHYKRILARRLELKKQGRKKEQEPLKLILNSTYGLLNNQYSQLNNPHLAFSICIYGQISLYVLSQRLAAIGAEIININTDGVAYRYSGDEDQQVFAEWEKEFGMTLETEQFTTWIQANVNNYLAVTESGYVVTKGGDVSKYHDHNYFANNDIRIVQMALVDYLIKGIPIQETLMNYLDEPILYQYVLQAGHTFQGVVTSDEPDVLLPTKVNRVFATKRDGVEILKKRQDGGLVKFADAPLKMKVWNGDVKDLEDFRDWADLQWYYDLTRKALERWE